MNFRTGVDREVGILGTKREHQNRSHGRGNADRRQGSATLLVVIPADAGAIAKVDDFRLARAGS